MASNPFAAFGSPEFLAAIQRLLPRGIAWPRDPKAIATGFWQAIADVSAAARAWWSGFSEVESFPPISNIMLADWEKAFGLPDPCVGQLPSIAARQQALLARMTWIGGESIPSLIALAALYGFVITITEFLPARAGGPETPGALVAGAPIYGPAWHFAFQVNAPAVTRYYFAAGRNVAGDPISWWGNQQLECIINRAKRATRTVIFAYNG